MGIRAAGIVAAYLAALGCQAPDAPDAPPRAPSRSDSIDPFVGTAGDHGQLDPSAVVPFGLVKLGPDTDPANHAGYDFDATEVVGFSHTRIGGVGCAGAGGNVRITPGAGAVPATPQTLTIDKATEQAGAGWWTAALRLPHGGAVRAELTATSHVGLHRYTFSADTHGAATLMIDVNRPLGLFGSGTWTASADRTELAGDVDGRTVCLNGTYHLHYVARFDPPFAKAQPVGTGERPNVALTFGSSVRVVRVAVALSTVDTDGARNNLAAEVGTLSFDEVRDAARTAWDEALAPVEVTGDAETQRLFDTMLYRSMLTPADITDADGRYRGPDGQVHVAEGWRRYHGWSTWDTYRTKHPLLVLLAPGRARDIARSLVELSVQGKQPWAGDQEPSPTVRTEHAGVILLDSLRKGLDVDVTPALDALTAEALAAVGTATSPDRQLEAAHDGWAVAGLVEATGGAVPASLVTSYAAWTDVWNDTFRDLGADADVVGARGLYEGTIWQYRWAPTFDLAGLMALDQGRAAFAARLDEFFDGGLYNHGNEPDLHAAYLYVAAGQPWKTQALVSRILTGDMPQWYGTHDKWSAPVVGPLYQLAPDGLLAEMDDDDGTMAAWYVFSAIGLYPLAPGMPYYALTRPLFDRITLHLAPLGEPPHDLTITVEGGGHYLRSVRLDGAVLDRAWLTHQELVSATSLVLTTGADPDRTFGTDTAAAVPSWTP